MKNKKVIIIIAVILLVVIGIIFAISNVMNAIKKDAEQTQKQIEEINVLYENFNENAVLFNERKEAYDKLMDKVYYTTIPKENEKILTALQVYDQVIGEIIKDGNQLKEKCNVYYSDTETMQKCSSYKITYESAMTLFIADVKRYNTLVENYNEWTKENSEYKKISTYVSKNVE